MIEKLNQCFCGTSFEIMTKVSDFIKIAVEMGIEGSHVFRSAPCITEARNARCGKCVRASRIFFHTL